MDDKLMYIPMLIHKITPSGWNVYTPNLMNKPSKFNKSSQSCQANELENVIIKLWGLV